jgi:hypothetical protein
VLDLSITAILLIDEVEVNTIIRVLPFFCSPYRGGYRAKCCTSGLNAGYICAFSKTPVLLKFSELPLVFSIGKVF